ncbi:hypothetical protein A2767_01175 [Candidatus Roizmanbacteria bacterium RIFCSPHIGHO2_01_FULL_35_10]|uniref:Uncharacterized protein n=1 Tax=Candidatus Roizmanbacteria bacterium RIFCSPLOWO2_01_FULL_35_13 TaxID=1802055 RepID=A0A1F7IC05_9BACT|nr:MAG: hypothetical protein A2767_01175 [Candidatus Roizmanbacteria bacterium RIFCSPHIGHO2_01_FULL_35_10]OGK40893.1 MAG: hypothetical protein A3A74_01545 [Candidatus Roizmanbacteria bacterium RIFCSPLOWO2_01_FULL_35_13]
MFEQTPRPEEKGFQLSVLAPGFYRIIDFLDNTFKGRKKIVGPYPNKKLATPAHDKMAARVYFPTTRVEFHFFKPEGAVRLDPSELEKIK